MITNNDQFVGLFEERLRHFTNAPYVVLVDRCTTAILLSIIATTPKTTKLVIPSQTYLSVPMTLSLHGYRVAFQPQDWVGKYSIGGTNVYDCAVGFEQNMYVAGEIQCLSFQQKKRLPIGKGGAILTDDLTLANKLRRLRHDGRDSDLTVQQQIDLDPSSFILGFHAYMSPDEAAKGNLLLNQLSSNYTLGSNMDYPDISKLTCFEEFV